MVREWIRRLPVFSELAMETFSDAEPGRSVENYVDADVSDDYHWVGGVVILAAFAAGTLGRI